MGAINYGTSNYLCNLGYNLNNDADENEEAQDAQILAAEEVRDYLDNIYLCYYDINIIPGYYEGFYLNVEAGRLYASDDEDKEDRIKEMHEIGRALIYLTNNYNLSNYSPSWCTGYKNADATINAIKQAVKKEVSKIYNA